MAKNKKQIVSLRLDKPDMSRIKDIAQRMHSKEADVYRFALRLGLARLAPLHDFNAKGDDLIPVFAEYGPELTSNFKLDGDRLNQLFNQDIDGSDGTGNPVDLADLELIALSATPESYFFNKLSATLGKPVSRGNALPQLYDYLVGKYVANGQSDEAAR